MKRIIITVSPEGETAIETRGYTGRTCKDASRPYEMALGTTTAERLTPEHYQRNTNGTNNTQTA